MTQDLDSPMRWPPQDLLGDRLARLQALVPEAFRDGELDFERLRAALGGEAAPVSSFGLTWAGKPEAVQAALAPAQGTLVPLREASVAFETARHVVIEGDNLEVLRLLQRSYHGAVKLIFIDPPYNTGKTFIYDDDFREGVKEYRERAGLVHNPEQGGRFHSRWLTMIYPRLVLARQLLTEDGFLVVAIDDHEVHHLRLLLDEVFGAENFIANVIWQKKYTRSNDARFFSDTHDHLLVYARRRDAARLHLLPRDEAQTKAYANPDHDPRGPWKATPLHAKSGRGQGFSYTFANGVVWSPPPGTFPRFSAETLATLDAEGALWFGTDGKAVPARKSYLRDVKDGVTPVTLWPYQEVGHGHEANDELKALLGECLFDNPKPTRLVRRFLQLMTSGEDLVLDFFAGSGTTGHAVLLQNAEDGGNRRFVLVQLPEPTGRADYPTIADITRARVSKALQALKPSATVTPSASKPPVPLGRGTSKVWASPHLGNEREAPLGEISATRLEGDSRHLHAPKVGQSPHVLQKVGDAHTFSHGGGAAHCPKGGESHSFSNGGVAAHCDVPLPRGTGGFDAEGVTVAEGYRAFRLDTSCFTPWPTTGDLESRLRAHISPLRPDRDEEAIVFELLLKAGLPLTTPIESLGPHTYRAGHLVLNLSPTLTEHDLQPNLIALDSALTDALKTYARLQGIPLTTV